MAFAGFDRLECPSAATMLSLFENTNFRWCGFYLGPAPSQPGATWMRAHDELRGQGWGLAPLFVGQQQADSRGSRVLTAEQGRRDAWAAAKLAVDARLRQGSRIFLDVESGGPLTPPMLEYVTAWVKALPGEGGTPAIYCSHRVASTLAPLVGAARFWIFRLDRGGPFDTPFAEVDPSGSSSAGATIWQYAQDTAARWAGRSLSPIDLDTSETIDPSA